MRLVTPAFLNRAKRAVLGTRYELSFEYVTPKTIQRLNRQYRKINKPTDILSFQLSDTSGEIVVCKSEVVKHAKAWKVDADTYLPYLIVHGMVHLSGHEHGRAMDEVELKHCRSLRLWHPFTNKKIIHGETHHRH